jgi:hypothetical protein
MARENVRTESRFVEMSTQVSAMPRVVRSLTEAEIAHYFDKGWVVARGMIDPEWAAELLSVGKRLMGEDGEAEVPAEHGRNTLAFFREYFGAAFQEPTIAEFVHSQELGRSIAKLLYGGGDGAVRVQSDFLFVKLPESRAEAFPDGSGVGPTAYHQDVSGSAPVLGDMVTLQVALGELTPEMGTMCFYEGSQALGVIYHPDGPTANPRLQACRLSEPLTLHPGDVTIHSYMTVHGAGTNRTDQPRWNLGATYFPAGSTVHGEVGDLFAERRPSARQQRDLPLQLLRTRGLPTCVGAARPRVRSPSHPGRGSRRPASQADRCVRSWGSR